MLFVVTAHFRHDAEPKRIELRQAFSDHIASNRPRLRLGGPLNDEQGRQTAIFYIAEAEDIEGVRHFVRSSPYDRADLYDRIDIGELTIEAGNLG